MAQRGRPKGSRNKPKILSDTTADIRRLKKQIKDLKAEKLSLPSGNQRRIELHREIKRLKQLLKDQKEFRVNKEIEIKDLNNLKEPLIAEILRLEPTFPKDLIDLNKFTVEQLQHHIDRVKEKARAE